MSIDLDHVKAANPSGKEHLYVERSIKPSLERRQGAPLAVDGSDIAVDEEYTGLLSTTRRPKKVLEK